MKFLQPFPSEPRPLVFAHRGASSIAPENTLASFRMARDSGCPGVELDIHTCASGELVVFHDFKLDRLTGAEGSITETSLSALKRLDAGAWKDARFKGERIPTLDEVFSEFGDSLYYDIEIKLNGKERTGQEKDLADCIERHGLASRVTVTSFNPFPLLYFKEIRTDIPTGIIWTDNIFLPWFLRLGAGAWISACDYLKPDAKSIAHPSILWLGAERRRALVPWVVDDPAQARGLMKHGASGFITNKPQEMGEFYA
jgi:glycerophosphoryl diester phosphodiesterase